MAASTEKKNVNIWILTEKNGSIVGFIAELKIDCIDFGWRSIQSFSHEFIYIFVNNRIESFACLLVGVFFFFVKMFGIVSMQIENFMFGASPKCFLLKVDFLRFSAAIIQSKLTPTFLIEFDFWNRFFFLLGRVQMKTSFSVMSRLPSNISKAYSVLITFDSSSSFC